MKSSSKKLAIAIPTYNRSDILRENLSIMLPELKQFNIPVYISDDSTDDKTEKVISELSLEYNNLCYRHNKVRYGHDNNFFATLNMPQEFEYVWYMGDSVYIKNGFIREILMVLEAELDFCFVNAYVKDLSCGPVPDVHAFLVERTWYLTLTGATIYGRKPREMIISAHRKAEWRNFVQLGLVLEYCSSRKASAYWFGKQILDFNRKKQSYWMKDAFKVFVYDWTNFVSSFPQPFTRDEIRKIIKAHAINTGLFNLKHLLRLRASNGLNYSLLKEYKTQYASATPIHPYFAYVIASMPVKVAGFIVYIYSLSKSQIFFAHSTMKKTFHIPLRNK